MSLMADVNARALKLGIPISAQLVCGPSRRPPPSKPLFSPVWPKSQNAEAAEINCTRIRRWSDQEFDAAMSEYSVHRSEQIGGSPDLITTNINACR